MVKPLTIIIFGFLISSTILTEFFSFLLPIGNPSYILLGMFSVYLSLKTKIGMFSLLFFYNMFALIKNIGFFEFSFMLFTKSIYFININTRTIYFIYLTSLVLITLSICIWTFHIGRIIVKKYKIGL